MKRIISGILVISICFLLISCVTNNIQNQNNHPSSSHQNDTINSNDNNYIKYKKTIAAGGAFAIAVRKDGTVVASGYNGDGECNVSTWTNIIEVAAGSSHAVGLKSDGTVVATGDNSHGQCEVYGWTDIVSISANTAQTVGLRRDGTLVSTQIKDTGKFKQYACGQDQVADIRDAVAVEVGNKHIAVLKSDGTVVSLGANFEGQCNTKKWDNIVQISAGDFYTLGLKKDGTVVTTPLSDPINDEEDRDVIQVESWRNVTMISAGCFNTYGICDDKSIVATKSLNSFSPKHENQVAQLENVCYIVDGHYFTLVLHNSGTVTLVGNTIISNGKIDVSTWTNIRSPFNM